MNTKYTFLLLAALLVGAGCGYDAYEAAPSLDEEEQMEPVSWEEQVLPIMTDNCTAAGCHVTGGYAPVLTADMAYDELIAMELVDTEDPESSPLYRWMSSRTRPMPPSGRLDDEKLKLVLWWIAQGAEEN